MTIHPIKILQQQGQFPEAIKLCLQALENQASPSLNALLGMLYAQNQEPEQAQLYLDQLLQLPEPPNAELLTDIAGIQLLLGQTQAALAQLNQALSAHPDFTLAQVRRGLVLMQLGRFQTAIADFESGLNGLPENYHSALHSNLARCHWHLGSADTALQHLKQAESAKTKEAWLWLAVDIYIALNDWANAEAAIQEGLENGINESQCLRLLAVVLAAQNKHDEAKHHLRKVLQKQPDDVAVLEQLAALASVRGHYGEAMHAIRTALKIEPDNAGLWTQLSHLGKRAFDENLPRQAAERALALTEGKTDVARADALTTMASVYSDAAEWLAAQDYYQQALALIPDYVPARLGLGHLLLQWGKIDEAVTEFESVSAQHPVAAYGALISARRFPDDLDALKRIEAAAYRPSLQGPVATGLLFDLAAAFEHRKDYAKAFHFAAEANRASREFLSYDAAAHHQHCLALKHSFCQDFFAQRANYGHSSTVPVFVLGMPRSGTTLVEQILGGHEAIHVAGEIGMLASVIQKLNAWERHVGSGDSYPTSVAHLTAGQVEKFAELVLEELIPYAPEARYIVDKMPHNFEHIGLIRLLFPEAAIIHVLREPRDVAVSNFFTDYQAKFGGMGFAYDLSDIGQQLLDYRELMAHWNAVIRKPILTVRYEDVVADTECQARRILDYLNLPWTDAVLNYQNLERAVKTASVWQVRQPIYKTSTEKWRRYAEFLQPLEAALTTPVADDWQGKISHLPAGQFFDGMACLHQQNGAQAEAIFNEILKENPSHAAARHMLGVALFQQEKLQAALAAMQTAIAQHGGHASWYYNLGAVLNALGQNQAAQEALSKSKQVKNLRMQSEENWLVEGG